MEEQTADKREHTPDKLIYIWIADVIQVPRTYLFNKVWEWSVGVRIKPDLYLTLHTKTYSRYISELNLKGKTPKYLKITNMLE